MMMLLVVIRLCASQNKQSHEKENGFEERKEIRERWRSGADFSYKTALLHTQQKERERKREERLRFK